MILSGENIPGEDFEQRLQEGRIRGWIEEQDLLNLEEALDRRSAARILHMYLRIVRGVKDAEDITPAYGLRDLFDCRVCANHIAQVYVRGIMDRRYDRLRRIRKGYEGRGGSLLRKSEEY